MRSFYIVILILGFLNGSCSSNVLSEFADTSTDAAIIRQAEVLANKGQYSAALTEFNRATATTKATRENQALLAGIYAGLCGLDFVTMSTNIANVSGLFFQFLQGLFPGGDQATADNCDLSEATLRGIGEASARNADENVLMLFLSMAKLGTYFSAHTEDSDIVADGTFDNDCTDISDESADEMVSGLGNLFASAAAAAVPGFSATDAIDCNDYPGFVAQCNAMVGVTDPANSDAAARSFIKTLVRESVAIGLGDNCTGDITTCNCP